MPRVNVSRKGQLVIPKELRKKYGIEPDSQVIVTEIDRHIAVLPATYDPIREGRGMFRFDRPVVEILRELRRAEKSIEQKLLDMGRSVKRGRRGRQ